MNGSKMMTEQQLALFKKNILKTLLIMREDIQRLLFDEPRPQRDSLVQQDHFLNALIHKIKEQLKNPDDVIEFTHELAAKYPLAEDSIADIMHYFGIDNGTKPSLR